MVWPVRRGRAGATQADRSGKGRTMGRSGKRGFTLVELMVVIGLISLLVAILAPYLVEVYTTYRRVRCANNLEKLGQGYAARTTDGLETPASGWTAALSPYVGNLRAVFFCPEDPNPRVDPRAMMNDVYLECYAQGGINDPAMVTWRVYFSEGGITSHDFAPWVWQLSQTQFDNRPALVQQFKTQNPRKGIPYMPDSNPNVWYIVWEDQAWHGGGDEDFYDMNCKVEIIGDDTYITPVGGSADYNFTLAWDDKGTRTVLMPNMKEWVGKSVKVTGGGGNYTSYGMNSVSEKLGPMRKKALILDYNHTIALCSPYDEKYKVTDRQKQYAEWLQRDPNDPRRAVLWARHFDRINTLFTDGSVLLMAPDKLNPNDLAAQTKYWDP